MGMNQTAIAGPQGRVRLRGPIACAVATLGVLLGVGIDLLIHSLAVNHEDGGVLDPGNPGHLIAGISLALLAGAVCLTLADARGARSRNALAAALAVVTALAVTGVGLAAAGDAFAPVDAHAETTKPDPAQLANMRAATKKYQDVDVARADGFYQASDDEARMGAHFSKDDWSDLDKLDISKPSVLLYTQRLSGNWELVGLGYSVSLRASRASPTDLTGAHWHRHRWNCTYSTGPFPTSDEGVPKAECVAQGGQWDDESGWELHVWPWLDNPLGPYADVHPRVP
jgi:hypothetical protein